LFWNVGVLECWSDEVLGRREGERGIAGMVGGGDEEMEYNE
jgi:hypothetical protein